MPITVTSTLCFSRFAAVDGPTLLLLCADTAADAAAVPAAVEAVRHSSSKYLVRLPLDPMSSH